MFHLPLAGGKRLRPIIAMLVADAINGSGTRTIPFGVAIELIHNFTLIHDDIMDADILRRGVNTVHVAYGIPTAINAGDVLFARAFEILTSLNTDSAVICKLVHEVANMVRIIGNGQQADLNFETRTDVTETDYLAMIEQKTAKMFEVSAKGGAMIAGATDTQINSMAVYGRLLGLAFQIRDDLLGTIGDTRKLGKPVGNDIKRGKKTLLIVHGLAHATSQHKRRILNALGNKNISVSELEAVIEILRTTGSIEYAYHVADDYVLRARKLLTVLPDTHIASKRTLQALVDYIIERQV
jgi:geranylgeranyl diphosphate synthase type I